MKQRIRKLAISLAIIAAVGYTYAVFVRYTGFAVPCVFHTITGLKCPGCGITGMCLSIIRLDFERAFLCNQMLFMLLPVLSVLFGSYTLGYVRTGVWSLTKIQTVLMYICIGLLVLFAVYRNIRGI